MATVHTVGHGARTLEELVSVLRSAEIELLVDVRMFPRSRRHPYFSRDALEDSLPEREVDYEWRGEALGGRRKGAVHSRHPAWRNASFRAYADHMDSQEFRSALEGLKRRSREGTRLALMCAETLWWRCHRRLIADALTVDGLAVEHLIHAGERRSHTLHEALRVDDSGLPVYDLGVKRELPFG